jgi:ankyrin repeat protein
MLYSTLNLANIETDFLSLFEDDEESILSDQFLPIVNDFNNRIINPENINEILSLCDYILMKDTLKFIIDHFSIGEYYILNEYHRQNYVLPGYMQGDKSLNEVGKYGNLRYIKHIFDDLDGSEISVIIDSLCRYGHLEALKYLFVAGYGYKYDTNTIGTAYAFGQLNCVKYMMEHNDFYKSLSQYDIHRIVNCHFNKCHLPCMKYIYENYINASEFIWSSYLRNRLYITNNFEYLQYIFDNGCTMCTDLSDLLRLNIGDNVECLQWALEHGTQMGAHFTNEVCKKGHVLQLEFALKNGAFIDEYSMHCAIFHDHIDCVKLLIKYGFVVTSRTFNNACKCGYLHILKYLKEIGCPSHIDATSSASVGGHIMCLKYLYRMKYPVCPNTCHYAFKNGHLNCLQLAFERGCPWKLNISGAMIRDIYTRIPHHGPKMSQRVRRKEDCLRWAMKNGNTWINDTYK